jgi:hypothetical protein
MGTSKVYKLTDGTEITSTQLADEAGISIFVARNRLGRSNVRELLLRPLLKGGGQPKRFKTYTLSDGSQWTIPEISEKLGVPRTTIAARLHKTKDVEWVLHPKRECKDDLQQKRIASKQVNRMIGDPDGFWKLFNRCT